MTIIVAALTKTQGVVMAADRLVSSGWEKQYHRAPKLWTTDQFALGAAGSLRAAQVLKHYVTWPKYRPDEDTDLERWLVTSLIPAVRTGTSQHGVVKNDCGVETLETSFLWAVGDLIAEVSGSGSVVVSTAGRMAIGSGYAEALGRLGDSGPWTEDDVVDAARRAIQANRGCGGPISVVDTKTLTIREVGA